MAPAFFFMPAGGSPGIIWGMNTVRENAKALFGVSLTAGQMQQMAVYEALLLEWNEKINLTAIRDVPGIRSKHFLDSLSCALAFGGAAPRSLIDVGTGAGFPGLVLKIAYPEMRLTLVESVGKKTRFCELVATELDLKDVTVLNARAEDVGRLPQHRQRYEWAVARAVARLPILLEYLLPLVRVGGHVLAQKGETGPVEVMESASALKVLGGSLRKVLPVALPAVADERHLVLIDKTQATPNTYPRPAGVASKKPL